MKITIDTKEDSKDDIRKAIKMLQALVESGEISYKEPVSSEQQTAIQRLEHHLKAWICPPRR